MFWVKLHIILLVIIIQFIALFIEKKTPYFPIEISRTIASGSISKNVFSMGVISLIITMILSDQLKVKYIMAWLGLVLLALYDDKDYWLMHMVGVIIMVIGLILSLCYSNTFRQDMLLILCAIIIYISRIVMKIVVVWGIEMEFNTYNIMDIFDKFMQIMYFGESVCKYPLHTLTVFRLCGVLQWIFFLMFTIILN